MANIETFDEEYKGETCPPDKKVNPDQEAWLLERLTELVELVQTIQRLRSDFVGASQPMMTGALKGAINGAAIEIVHTLGLYPSYSNIKEQPYNIHDVLLRGHTETLRKL